MVRILILGLAVSILLNSCNGQTSLKLGNKQDEKISPGANYKVNKEYDKDGKLLRYDSTYSYYYSNVECDSVKRDSILDIFKDSFNHQLFFSDDPFFNEFFFQDSLIPYDFYKKDFFSHRYRNNKEEFDEFFHQMDSIKNEFFNHQFKESEPPEPKKPTYSL
jgi:hypothetical protein